ncbi:MAG: hypothetical protein GXY07_14865 [Candidatus Hydrogenedentes bacterium]|nr:hypothetical protein [Candidatus Hydrogenedentota bacterium]
MKQYLRLTVISFMAMGAILTLSGCPPDCECEGEEKACTKPPTPTKCAPPGSNNNCYGCLDVYSSRNQNYKLCVDADDHKKPCPSGEKCDKPCSCQCDLIKWVYPIDCGTDAGGDMDCDKTACGEPTAVSVAAEFGCE